MTTDTAEFTSAPVGEDAPISKEEVEAVRAQLLAANPGLLDELKGKNSAVLTVMMPLALRVMIDEAARKADGTDGSAADWARELFASQLNFTLPTKSEQKSKTNKRDVKVQQQAQRAMVAELIERARKGEINL